MGKIKLLWVGDAVVGSGFARVTHGVLDNLNKIGGYDINVLGVNYLGDPHEYAYNIWPAMLGGDALGYGRIKNLIEILNPDIVMLFNDIWVVEDYISRLHSPNERTYKIATYFPVDADGYKSSWVDSLKEVDSVAVYTNFAEEVIRDAGFNRELHVIPHGFDPSTFFPVPREEAMSHLGGVKPEDFIVFNGNRNQPRKRIDVTIKGFCRFARNAPNAKLYLHMGLLDAGWDIISLMERECKKNGLTVGDRLIITSPKLSPGSCVSVDHLNMIYNSTNVGINTSLGEGWGLVSFEQAACKIPQIVTNYAAAGELFSKERGILLDPIAYISAPHINTEGGLVSEYDLAESLEWVYNNQDKAKVLADNMYNYMQDPKFTWESVASKFDSMFKNCIKYRNIEHGNNLAGKYERSNR